MQNCADISQWTPEEVQLYLARMREGLRNPKIHAYMPV